MFRIVTSSRAQLDIERFLTWIGRRSPQGAVAWMDAYDEAVSRLEVDARSHPLLPQAKSLQIDVRFITFRTAHGLTYLILFVANDSEDEVRILRVRGPGQAPVRRRDL
jgi:plasmid stabilization system protein ParE